MAIRPARPEDAADLARVLVEARRSAYRGFVPVAILDEMEVPQRKVRWRLELQQKSAETIVMELEGRIHGFVTVWRCPDEDVSAEEDVGGIRRLYVAPGQWRGGIGASLSRHGEHVLHERGYRRALLWVLAANEPARRFYEAMGYRLDGTSRMHGGGIPLEVLRYAKDLG